MLLGAGAVTALVAPRRACDSPSAVPHHHARARGHRPAPARPRAATTASSWTGSPCRGGHLCATLTVPLDYRDPAGETIELALLKVPAADPDQRIGSLVVNPGGPGAPGTDYAAQAETVFREPLLDAYDIVGFDPRGTGASDPVDCLTDAELDDYVAEDPDPDTRRGGRGPHAVGRGVRARLRSSARATWPRTSPPSRPRATWTCCAPRWASPS